MHLNRALEIVEAPDNIKVLYEKTPVWIENINRETGTAQVKLLGNSQILNVPVSHLNEEG